MIESREELRRELAEEYKTHKADKSCRDSLLCRYFREKEERRAREKLESKESARKFLADKKEEKEYYLRLRVAYLAMGDRYITRDEYQEVRKALVDQLLKQKKLSEKTRKSLPGASQEELEDFLLERQADAFIDNESRVNNSKKENDDVRLLRFYERNSGQGDIPAHAVGRPEAQAGRKLDEAFIKKCEKVCRLLRNDMQEKEQTRVILPLYVEESTGAGIYLMGRDNIPETEISETKLPKAYTSLPCYPCVVCYEECAREKKIKWGSTRINGVPMDDRRMIFYLSVKVFGKVEDAAKYLSKELEKNDSLKNGYRLDNAAMEYDVPPEELDPEFSSFFYKKPQILSKEDLSEEEREIIEREDREEKAARRRKDEREKRLQGAEKKRAGKIQRTV